MFEPLDEKEPEEQNPAQEEQNPAQYAGVIIGLISLPLLVYFTHIGKPELGMSAFICMGMTLVGIGLCWDLKKHVWFWVVMFLVIVLQLLLVLWVPWSLTVVNRVTLLPLAVADLLIVVGIVRFVEKFIMGSPPSSDDSLIE